MGNFTGCWRLKRSESKLGRIADIDGSDYTAAHENISLPSAVDQEKSTFTLNRTGSLQRNASFNVRSLSRSLSYRIRFPYDLLLIKGRNVSIVQDFLCADAYEQNPETIPRGTALLFEFNDFDTDFKSKYDLSSLSNARKDIGDLSDVFLRAGYDVDRRVNATVKEARNAIKNISNSSDQSNPDSFICVLLTHMLMTTDGSKQYLACFDDYISCRKLLNPLRKSRCLSGVPKIIFINFSVKVDNLVRQVFVPQYAEESDRTACASLFPGIDYAPVDADFLMLYADCSKVCSSQYPELGSHCVQKLSSLLSYNSRQRDFVLMDLLAKLNRYLCTSARITEEKSAFNALGHSEPLVVISTLRKDFHLFRAVQEKEKYTG